MNTPVSIFHRCDCQLCEQGKVFVSRYGGNDPDVWQRREPCDDCDGNGNVYVEDEYGLIPKGSITLSANETRWFEKKTEAERIVARQRVIKAVWGDLVGYGRDDEAAIRALIHAAEDRADAEGRLAEAA